MTGAAPLACSMAYPISYRQVVHSAGPCRCEGGGRVSPRKSDSRERMVLSAATLLREYGASATSVDRVLAHSGAPRGSVYHHFPGGRAQLIDEAVTLAGD